MTDFKFTNHGSICLLQPLTEDANEWIAEHLPEDAPTFGTAVAIEPRYAGDILEGIDSDGLEVN